MAHYTLGQLLAGASAIALLSFAAPAVAQDAAIDQAAPVDQAASDDTPGADGAGEIVVTGSRIVRDGYQAPTPVTVIGIEQLTQAAPTNIPDGLNQLPQFQGSRNQQGGGQNLTNANRPDAGNYLNLRGVGSVRSLILLDGRRVPPTSFEGTVDINTLPQALIQRVDVVTAGASAVYGADAVSGVVNFVLDTRFTGVKGNIQAGISDYGDDGSQRISVAAGTKIGENFHIVASAEHFERDGIKHKYNRPYYAPIYYLGGDGSAANPFRTLTGARNTNYAYGGLVTSGPFQGQQFLPDGSLAPFVLGASTGNSATRIGGDGAISYPEQSLTAALKTDQFFGHASWEVSPGLELFAQAGYATSDNRYTNLYDSRPGGAALTIFADNPYLTTAQRNTLVAANVPSFRLARYSRDFGNLQTHTKNRSLNSTIGAQGNLGDYKFEAYYSHGDSKLETHQPQVYNQRFFAAIDAVRDPVTNNIVCRVTLVNPTLLPGCKPIDVLGEMTPDQAAAAKDYVYGDSSFTVRNVLNEVAANVSGSPFSTWAGKVSLNVGGNARWQSLRQESTGDPTQKIDYTGIRGVTANPTPYYFTNVGAASGRYSVWELYGETVVPLANDLPLIRELEFNGAYRYTNYSTSGGVSTWKAGLSWKPIDDLRLRATRSRDIRAPTLYDLFAGQQVNPVLFTDTLTGVTTNLLTTGGGNPNLKPEKGNTLTIGGVYQPSYVPNLSFSVDYYNLRITDAITTLGQNTIRDACISTAGTSALCAFLPRPISQTDTSPANFPTSLILNPINIASLETEGVDVELSYRFDLSGLSQSLPGRLGFRAIGNYVTKYVTVDGIGGRPRDLVGTPEAIQFRGLLSVDYSNGGFSSFLQARYIDKLKRDTAKNTGRIYLENDIDPVVYLDMTLSYKVAAHGGTFEPFLSINNLLNREPPIVASGLNAGAFPTLTGVYDVTGRYFSTGVRFKF